MHPREIEQLETLKAEQARQMNAKSAMPATTALGASCDSPSRERTAREVLSEICMIKQVEADELNELLKALPAELPWRADRALRRLIQTR